MKPHDLPEPPAGAKGLFLSPATAKKLLELARSAAPEVVLDPSQFTMIERAGKKFYRYVAPGGLDPGRAGGKGNEIAGG